MESIETKRILNNWQDENNSAAIYQTLADSEKDKRLAEVYQRMVQVELKHAAKWEDLLKEGGESIPIFKTRFRTKVQIWMAKNFGAGSVLPGMQAMEQAGSKSYREQPDAREMAGEEKSHAFLINQITRTMRGGFEGGVLAQLEGRHRASGGNALRAGVLGANDGLVSNLSLVMGVAGAAFSGRTILITGIAGLLAGACSMALGEWLSVQSSRELYEHQIAIETKEIENSPQEEVEELALIYEARGLQQEQAVSLASQIMVNKEYAIQTLAREELGVNPDDLGGSAWEAAITSFGLFAVGAVIPVIPFFFSSGNIAVISSILLSTVALFILGAVISLFTGRPAIYSGIRMVIFSLIAAALTFGIGRIIGVSLGG
jgi:VIT1/CCC1 family predicted Fe2+/Mn2+ transporter/rubrerythrin